MSTTLLNRETGEWIQTIRPKTIVKILTTRLTEKNSLIEDGIGESRWRRTDHIVKVPFHLQNYVYKYYTGICVE